MSRKPDRGYRPGIDVLPATAGRAVHEVISGPLRTWARPGGADSPAWLRSGRDVIVLQADPAALLPNGVVGPPAMTGRRAALPDSGVVGEGRLDIGWVCFEVVRWWDPVPQLRVAARLLVASRLAELSSLVEPVDDGGLAQALSSAVPADIHRAASALLGMGEGPIPEGDEVLIGSLAALRLLGPALRAPAAHRLLAELAAVVLAGATMATSAPAASLLHHAHAGAVSAPLGRLMTALADGGDVAGAAAELLPTRPAGGPAIATGVLAAAGCLVGVRA